MSKGPKGIKSILHFSLQAQNFVAVQPCTKKMLDLSELYSVRHCAGKQYNIYE
jgi:hypothetical protein